MKKFLAILLSTVLVLSLCSTAFATTFTRVAPCVNENNYVDSVSVANTTNSGTRVKIYHNAQGCSNSYTNHFRVWDKTASMYRGSKFVTPGGTYFINCTKFKTHTYLLRMRGNTKYHENEGLSSITLAGWFLLPSQQ